MKVIKTTGVLFLIAICISATAQKKANVQSHKIKSTIVLEEDFDSSKGKQKRESFTRFDALGNTIEEIEYDKSGKEKTHVYNDFDTDGNKIRETYLKSNGVKDKVIEYKFQDGLKVEKIVYYGNGKIKSKKKYVYEFDK